jgi:hypothetical protein
VEPCEEIRLQLMLLLGDIVRTAGHAIGAYAAEAVMMAEAGFLDAFYEINVQACSVVTALNGAGPPLHLAARAPTLRSSRNSSSGGSSSR